MGRQTVTPLRLTALGLMDTVPPAQDRAVRNSYMIASLLVGREDGIGDEH